MRKYNIVKAETIVVEYRYEEKIRSASGSLADVLGKINAFLYRGDLS